MAPSDVTRILEGLHLLRVEVTDRLARIETKQDTDYSDKRDLQRRVRRLELAGIAVLITLGAKIAGLDLPIVGD
jgi:hypothetical protein